MNKRLFDPKLYSLPTTQLILGTRVEDEVNFMALAWVTRVNFRPPLIAIGVNKSNISHDMIIQSGGFSLNMPSRNQLRITDYVGLASARTTDKSKLFKVNYGESGNAPLIDECPLCLELKLYANMELPTNSVFIGEIIAAWCDPGCLKDNQPDIEAIDPFLLTMPDNTFWEIGESIGKAWHDGKKAK